MGYSGNMGCYNNYGEDYGNCNRNRSGSAFALIVVLFILLIIVGATFMHKGY
ncbi:YjcZ family sporulation protein [Lysinibacillus sp. NPDC097287]|uniref:YjcZ family sporulation protein n=1 Tax=Lysinibacillus sp. NPDC097287 TaxID=3364144 RepID=UPI00381278DB